MALITHTCTYALTLYQAKFQDISYFENSVDPDQLASEKPADQDRHCFHSACLM